MEHGLAVLIRRILEALVLAEEPAQPFDVAAPGIHPTLALLGLPLLLLLIKRGTLLGAPRCHELQGPPARLGCRAVYSKSSVGPES